MIDFDVVDKDGEWVAGVAPLGLRDPTTQVWFPYNQPVKVKLSDWIKGQMGADTIKRCADPLAPAKAEAKPVTK